MSEVPNYKDEQAFKDVWQIGVRLFIICAFAALSLGVINQFTNPAIKGRLEAEKQTAIKSLVNGGVIGTAVTVDDGVVQAYYPVQKHGQITAYILELTGVGYGGNMKILAAYEPTGKILAARLVEHNETPGLGDKAADPSYMRKFIGTGAGKPVPVTKEMIAGRGGAARQAYKRPLYNSFGEWLFGKQEPLAVTGAAADSVSGATITFTGVSRALADGALYVSRIRGDR